MAIPYGGKDRKGNLVIGAREDAVMRAARTQIDANRNKMNETGIMDHDNDLNLVRQACWDALDKYDAEHPEDTNA